MEAFVVIILIAVVWYVLSSYVLPGRGANT
jgi:hypothetical protein